MQNFLAGSSQVLHHRSSSRFSTAGGADGDTVSWQGVTGDVETEGGRELGAFESSENRERVGYIWCCMLGGGTEGEDVGGESRGERG